MNKIGFPQIGYIFLMAIICSDFYYPAQAKTWMVGPEFILKKPSSAIKRAQNGDVIKIIAGVYENDYAIINQDNLTLEGINGYAHLRSSGPVPGGKAIWVTNGKNIIIRKIEFSGAKVPDKNGSGIRLQRGSLIIDDCYFHDNQMGILTSGNKEARLLIQNSEFNHNILLIPDMRYPAHNIYVGMISEFIMEHSISRGAQYGHGVKSRARTTIIRQNRIFDEGDISASYLIDVPNGGKVIIENNYLYKNKNAQNNTFISYGAEGMKYKDNALSILHNTAINESGITFLLKNHSPIEAQITDNDTTNISANEIPGIEKGGFLDKMKNNLHDYLKEIGKLN
ncbi:MAG: hypothetical protein JKY45_01940 [Emcibacter sp.]|nr:hypothetical protein [Emcibacter sp.]